MQSTPRPNFFIVGAPRCGTTALYSYLRGHPFVFMSPQKEPNYFAADYQSQFSVSDEASYLRLFAEAGNRSRIGEASSRYLMSEVAATAIHEFNAHARIIIMLRNPVDMMYSLHAHTLYRGGEDLRSFGDALAAEAERKLGRGLPPGTRAAKATLYRQAATFSPQVERYFAEFPRDQVHVIIFDDFASNTAAAFRSTCAFLGIPPVAEMAFSPVNESKQIRSIRLKALLGRPSPAVRRLARSVLPLGARTTLGNALARLNTRRERPPPMDPVLRKQLLEEFAPEVRRLSELLGRDLTHWSRT